MSTAILMKAVSFVLLAISGVENLSRQADHPLNAVCDRYWEALMRHTPTRATAIGDDRYNDLLDDLSFTAGSEHQDAWRSNRD